MAIRNTAVLACIHQRLWAVLNPMQFTTTRAAAALSRVRADDDADASAADSATPRRPNTRNPPYRVIAERESQPGAPGSVATVYYQSITWMPEYANWSFEELHDGDDVFSQSETQVRAETRADVTDTETGGEVSGTEEQTQGSAIAASLSGFRVVELPTEADGAEEDAAGAGAAAAEPDGAVVLEELSAIVAEEKALYVAAQSQRVQVGRAWHEHAANEHTLAAAMLREAVGAGDGSLSPSPTTEERAAASSVEDAEAKLAEVPLGAKVPSGEFEQV